MGGDDKICRCQLTLLSAHRPKDDKTNTWFSLACADVPSFTQSLACGLGLWAQTHAPTLCAVLMLLSCSASVDAVRSLVRRMVLLRYDARPLFLRKVTQLISLRRSVGRSVDFGHLPSSNAYVGAWPDR